jgi:hypothetical protein
MNRPTVGGWTLPLFSIILPYAVYAEVYFDNYQDWGLSKNWMLCTASAPFWQRPTSGHPHANPRNARTFLANARRAGVPLYFFEFFDEGLKPGAAVERAFGYLDERGAAKVASP